MRRGPLYLAAGTAVLAVAGIALHAWSRDDPDPPPPADIVCHAGAYLAANGRLVMLTPSDDGLRYRLESGESGLLTQQPDGRWTATLGWTDGGPAAAAARIGGCDSARIEFGLAGEPLVAAERDAFRVRETKFQSRGIRLAGRLVMPRGDEPVPLAVVLHGSKDYSARLYYPEQHQLPAQGICGLRVRQARDGRLGRRVHPGLLPARGRRCMRSTRRDASRAHGPGASASSAAARPAGSGRSPQPRRRSISFWSGTAWLKGRSRRTPGKCGRA